MFFNLSFFFFFVQPQQLEKKEGPPPCDVTHVIESVVTTPFPIPTMNETILVPLFFRSPMTVARWNVAFEFVREFGPHNPEWKILQGIPCTSLLEGAIISSMNVSF